MKSSLTPQCGAPNHALARTSLREVTAHAALVLIGCTLVVSLAQPMCVSAQDAQRPTYRLALLLLDSDEIHGSLARDLTEQLRLALARRPELTLKAAPVSVEQLSLAQDCDSAEPACLERIAQSLHVDGMVLGNLTTDASAQLARLRHYDAASHHIKSTALATLARVDSEPAIVQRKAAELVDDLFALSPARSPFARPLAPAHAHIDGEADATLAPVALSTGMPARDIAGYALLGGAVLSAGLSVLSFVEIDRAQSNDAFERYRKQVGQLRPSARDVCDEAGGDKSYGVDAGTFQRVKNSCGIGRTFEVLQFVFIGGAVLSSGLSAYLLLGPRTEQPSFGTRTFTLHPTVGKGGATLGARFKF